MPASNIFTPKKWNEVQLSNRRVTLPLILINRDHYDIHFVTDERMPRNFLLARLLAVMNSEGTTWYFAGRAKINDGMVRLPPTIIFPDETDRDLICEENEEYQEIQEPFRESDDLYWHYQIDTGTVVFSHPRLEESREYPRNKGGYNLEPNFYEKVGRGGYAVNPTPGDGSITSWVANLPVNFFPDEFTGNPQGDSPVPPEAALQQGTSGWVLFRKGMNVGATRSCYLLRRVDEITAFVASEVRSQDELIVLESGFQEANNIDSIIQNAADESEEIFPTPRII